MRFNRISVVWLILSTFSSVNSQFTTAHAQGAVFTYQGRLNDASGPASGLYDVRFLVLDAPTNGNLVAGPVIHSAIGITNGLFSVTLDFGNGVFTGPDRWLELDVRTNGGGAFTPLLPLQPIQSVPYAIMANTASNLLGSLPAAQMTGTIPLAQLPTLLLTNGASGVNLSGTFTGNGSGITNIPGSAIVGGVGVSASNVTNIVTDAVSGKLDDVARNLTISCWGDSLTYGAGAANGYPYYLGLLSSFPTINNGIGGQTSSQILTNFQAHPDQYNNLTVIWSGRNNYYTNGNQVFLDIASMVSALGHTNYLVLSVLNSTNEYIGTPQYQVFTNQNAQLADTYGKQYRDIRGWMASANSLAAVNITPTSQDLIDIANGVPPTSLHSDFIHLNDAGYRAVAIYIYRNWFANARAVKVSGQALASYGVIGGVSPGTVYSTNFVGNGAGITNIVAVQELQYRTGHIALAANDKWQYNVSLFGYPDNTLDVGDSTYRWRNGFFRSNVYASSFIGDGSGLANIVVKSLQDSGQYIQKATDGTWQCSTTLFCWPNETGNIGNPSYRWHDGYFGNNVYAGGFYGSGAGLTNIPGNSIQSSTAGTNIFTAAAINALRNAGSSTNAVSQAAVSAIIATNLIPASNIVGIITGNGAGLTNINASSLATPPGMALIVAGAFMMGDNLDGDNDATPTVTVNVSGFYMDVNLVSYSQWQSVYYWATSHGYGFANVGVGKAANHPVQTVDWYDVVKWSNARSQQAGKTPVYYTDVELTRVYTNGEVDNIYVNWAAKGYRLPTEAEWEKAARGGLSEQRFPWGNIITESLANYNGSASQSYDLGPSGYNAIGGIGGTSPATSPIGSFARNTYGLYDMAGNVSEWCWDWYGTPYAGGSDPPGGTTVSRVFRGGAWYNDAHFSRCAYRGHNLPSNASNTIGFRCVMGL